MVKLSICVLGYHYWPEVYDVLTNINRSDSCNVYVVKRGKEQDEPDLSHLYGIDSPNVGLDVGGYDFFLKNFWDWKSGVLFMHDDIRIAKRAFSVVMDYSGYDRVFFFGTKKQEYMNRGRKYRRDGWKVGKSTRAFYCSRRFLKAMLNYTCCCHEAESHYCKYSKKVVPGMGPHTGFFYDKFNYGTLDEDEIAKSSDMREFNCGVRHLAEQRRMITEATGEHFNADISVVTPEIWPAMRDKGFI